MKTLFVRLNQGVSALGNALRSPVLLIIRLYWGWQFFLTGKGKLMDLSKPTQYFESLHIPFPHFNSILAGSTECLGGLLLLVGLATRLVSIPLMILLVVAYATADLEAARALFSDPDKFTGAAEFLFLFGVVIVFVCGPGLFSLDALIVKYFKPDADKGAK